MWYDNNLLQEKPYSVWWTGYSVVVDHYVIHHELLYVIVQKSVLYR